MKEDGRVGVDIHHPVTPELRAMMNRSRQKCDGFEQRSGERLTKKKEKMLLLIHNFFVCVPLKLAHFKLM